MSEAEPRRSVRSTKGQHKALDALDQPLETKRRGKKSSKKQSEPEPETEEDELIRCVCGATSQDGYAEDEPWIGCEGCGVWQHNVCVGMSIFGEDLEDVTYYCEQCKPEEHKDLVEAIARGERPWDEKRRQYEEEKAAEEDEKKKKKGTKKGKKRQSELSQDDPRSSQKSAMSSASPAPEKKASGAKTAAGKRKERHDSADTTTTKEPSKLRKVSESESVPVAADYEPPNDLPNAIGDLPSGRQGSAKLLQKGLAHAINVYEKEGGYNPADGVSNDSRAERLSIAIERAVHDSHPNVQEYAKQCRTLSANLKSNSELIVRLLNHTLTPPMLAVMTSDQLASDKQQQETAAARERSMRQSIIATEETQTGPRYRRTHKGEELIEGDGFAVPSETPSFPQRQINRESSAQASKAGAPTRTAGPGSHARTPSGEPMRIDTQQSPSNPNFDINKVFSSVKSPTGSQRRRPSAPAPVSSQGPGDDPDVDRLLQDDGNESPPYSPTEETDPDVVWRGKVQMTNIANFQAKAKHVGGADLAKTLGISWKTLVPQELVIGGRLSVGTATEYLCGMRWSPSVDVVVASLTAAYDDGKKDFDRIYEYFDTRQKIAVVGDKTLANVKDTYLIPVPAGTGNHPEFILNLEDNYLPQTRDENMLLLVIVFRNDNSTMTKLHGSEWNNKAVASPSAQASATPTPAPSNFAHRSASLSGPSFSPTTPHVGPGGFPPPQQPQPTPGRPLTQEELQQQGEAVARDILGEHISCSTVAFILPQAHAMQASEWHIVRSILDREPQARDNLKYLGELIEKEGQAKQQQQQQQQQQQPQQSAPPQPTPPAPFPQPGPPHPAAQQPYVQQQGAPPPVAPSASPKAPQSASPPTATRQTPISLPSIPGMPASVHQSYQAAQAQARGRVTE
ncbi:spoc domain-containing protein [Diaporthe amygdali]|uniref:spoc domain-containing protein n=1 Tax=Phomopsis amygdali TaxID=1214568 RepID=UPI0022FE42EB|nr:spoc domain-containing protein [Diaporthe amygdali]KAJ0110064.1 spoc domain-containing protein [Diaporthe amygdali]